MKPRLFQTLPLSFVLLLFLAFSSSATIEGPPITNNDYKLDLRQGPIIGSAKQVALGGAYIGIAEGIASLNSNPAGVAFRPARSKTKFDWDWTAGIIDLKSNDFDNNGSQPPNYSGHKIVTLGLMGQWGPWGFGFLNNGEKIQLTNASTPDEEYVLNANSLCVGRQFLDQELTFGLSARSTLVKLKTERFDPSIGKISGVGFGFGGLWNPKKGPFRLGFSLSTAIDSNQKLTETSTAPVTVNGLIVPNEAVLPAQAGIGVSYQVPSAPFWRNHPWLVSSDLLVVAPTSNAVGVESVIAQVKQPVGEDWTASFRLGTEVGVFPKWLRMRLGTYYEPSYYEGVSGRMHMTGGFESKLAHTSLLGEYDWGFTYSVDAASDYLNQYFSLGFWYP